MLSSRRYWCQRRGIFAWDFPLGMFSLRSLDWHLCHYLETHWTWCKGQSWTHGSRCGRPGNKKTCWYCGCSNENSTPKQRFCILVLLLKSHPPLCVCICKGGALKFLPNARWWESQIGEGLSNKFLICQITAEEIISLPVNSTQSGSSVKQTNDVKNENCNKLLVGPIITCPPTLLESYLWNIISNISQNLTLIFLKMLLCYLSKHFS